MKVSFSTTITFPNYITYEDAQLIKKLKTDGGQGMKVVKRFKVNKELITKDLEARNVIAARADLAETLEIHLSWFYHL